jgi:AI-2 transport protein TqsA
MSIKSARFEAVSGFPRSCNSLLTLGALVVVLAGVKSAESIVNPLLLALFIAAISAPLYTWLLNKRLPVVAALLCVIFAIVFVGGSVTSLVSSSLGGFSETLPQYQLRLQTMFTDLVVQGQSWGLSVEAEDLAQIADPSAIMGFVGTAFNSLLGVLTNTVFILLLVAFILIELSSVQSKLAYVSGTPVEHFAYFEKVLATMNRYFAVKSLLSLITAVPITLVLFLLEVDYPLLWGLLVFLLNFVPNIGSLIAAVPPILLALVDLGYVTALWVLLTYLAVNNVVGNMIEPKVLGRSLGLSTLVVFLSLVFWGWLLGPVGMFLSVPITVTIKIGLERSEEMRWLAVWLGTARDDHKLPS